MKNLVNEYVASVIDGFIPETEDEQTLCEAITYIIDTLVMLGEDRKIRCIGCKYMRNMWNHCYLKEDEEFSGTYEQELCSGNGECYLFYNFLMCQAKQEYDVLMETADNMEAML